MKKFVRASLVLCFAALAPLAHAESIFDKINGTYSTEQASLSNGATKIPKSMMVSIQGQLVGEAYSVRLAILDPKDTQSNYFAKTYSARRGLVFETCGGKSVHVGTYAATGIEVFDLNALCIRTKNVYQFKISAFKLVSVAGTRYFKSQNSPAVVKQIYQGSF